MISANIFLNSHKVGKFVIFTTVLLLGFLFSNYVYAVGSATVIRGHQPLYVGWHVTGGYFNAPNCAPNTDASPLSVRNAWMLGGQTSARFGTVSLPKPTVTGTFYFNCTHTSGAADSTSLIVNDCAVGYTWNSGTEVCDSAPPPTLNMSALPTTVDSGGTSVITWTASNSNICTASNGWSGNPSAAGGSSPVNPIANTTYTLTCSGPGGSITRSADVSVPSGGIQASPRPCTIFPGGTSCQSTITWNYSNFLGPALVTQGTTIITDPSGVSRPVTPTDSIFTLRDTGGNFSRQVDANAICTGTEVWTDTFCAPIPVITITPTPELVRSGSTANVDITVNSNFDLTCTLVGGVNTSFSHTASPSPRPYTRTTTPLNSARIISITCTSVSYSVITNTVETRVRVVPIIQEI